MKAMLAANGGPKALRTASLAVALAAGLAGPSSAGNLSFLTDVWEGCYVHVEIQCGEKK